jgi:hypothetical protein
MNTHQQPALEHNAGAYNVLMGVLLKELSKGLGLSSMLQVGR